MLSFHDPAMLPHPARIATLGFVVVLAMACSEAADDTSADQTSSGGFGNAPLTGGAPATGAVSSTGGNVAVGGTGGMIGSGATPGTGGAGTGAAFGTGASPGAGGTAGHPSASICPPGSESMVPNLEGKSLGNPIAGVPSVGGGFLEGPVWHDGALYLSQITFQGAPVIAHILKYTPGSGFETFVNDAGSNGIAVDANGLLVTANQKVGGIVSFDPQNPSAPGVTLTDEYGGKPFTSPNDLALRGDGNVYFTDPSYQCSGCDRQPDERVYRLTPEGAVEVVPTTQEPPNGIALSPDGNTLYVGGSVLTAHPVESDGSVGAGAPFGDNVTGTDGLGMDCAGNLYVALHGAGTVLILDPGGEEVGSLGGISQMTNVAFGGPNRTTLFVTSFGDDKGQLRSVELNVPGYPY